MLDFLAEKQPSLKAKNPADFVDSRFVRKLKKKASSKNFPINSKKPPCVSPMP